MAALSTYVLNQLFGYQDANEIVNEINRIRAIAVADPSSPDNYQWWWFTDEASPQAVTLRVRLAGVTHEIALGNAGDVFGPASSTSGRIATFNGTNGKILQDSGFTVADILGGSGQTIQIKNTQTGAVNTGSTVLPADDTIPQNTEGDEYMTLAITPTSATNKLKIEVVFVGAVNTAARTMTVALFQDTTADALAAVMQRSDTANTFHTITFTHYMTAGTTSATTFKVRVGVETSGTITFNGAAAGRFMGGVMASSITITEYVP